MLLIIYAAWRPQQYQKMNDGNASIITQIYNYHFSTTSKKIK